MTRIEKTVAVLFRLKAIDALSSWYVLDTLESLQPNLFAT